MTSIKSIYCNISIPSNSTIPPPLHPLSLPPRLYVFHSPHLGIFQVDSVLVQSHTVLPYDWLRSVVNVTVLTAH